MVILAGEIDIYSAPEFKEVLVDGIEAGAKRIDRGPLGVSRSSTRPRSASS